MVDWAVTGKTLYFGYLTYGSRTANWTDSPYQTVMGYLGTFTRENPLLLLLAIFQASIVFGARRRAASAWLAVETYFPKIIPPTDIWKLLT